MGKLDNDAYWEKLESWGKETAEDLDELEREKYGNDD